MNRHLLLLLVATLLLASCSRPASVTVSAPTPSLTLATPVSDSPAAGICADFQGSLVTITLESDVPAPRCARVRADQHLKVINSTDQTGLLSLGAYSVELKPGQEYTIDAPFGSYLLPGVHHLSFSAPPGAAEIWLTAQASPQP